MLNVSRYASSDWLHILWSFPRSTIMVNILSPVLVTTAWTCMIALLHRGLPHFVYKLLQACSGCVAGTSRPSTSGLRMPCRVLQATAPTLGRIAFLKGFSKQPHSIVGSAMSLLLVFRTNTAYTRFWEVTAYLSTSLFARSFSVFTSRFHKPNSPNTTPPQPSSKTKNTHQLNFECYEGME
jgi:predicted membrane chloride channel (bestrophin family)